MDALHRSVAQALAPMTPLPAPAPKPLDWGIELDLDEDDRPTRSEREYGNVNDYYGVPRGEL